MLETQRESATSPSAEQLVAIDKQNTINPKERTK